MAVNQKTIGYLPDESPSTGKLILFALQQILVMFPATVMVALLTGFHVSTTIFASGLATLGFILITRRQIPLYYGSSFSYISAIVAMTGAKAFAGPVADDKIAVAQFGIIMSGLVSIAAGLIIKRFGQEAIERVLPATVTGSVAIIIGMSLAASALTGPVSVPEGLAENLKQTALNLNWTVAIVTLLATVLFSVYLKGTWSQVPILLGILAGYILSAILTLTTGISIIDFKSVASANFFTVPHFTLPIPNLAAILAIMPIAIATIPESTAHLYQLDIYVNDLAEKKKSEKKYKIADKLGLNLIGDGIGDIISGAIGGPAGTNYGENLSTMAITKNFSTLMLIAASVITMILSFFGQISAVVYTIPGAVIGGVSIYLFGVIGAQGVAIMINKKVDLFDSRNLAVIATILIIGIGGSFGFPGGMIPIFGASLPAIATAALTGIVLNLILQIGKKAENK